MPSFPNLPVCVCYVYVTGITPRSKAPAHGLWHYGHKTQLDALITIIISTVLIPLTNFKGISYGSSQGVLFASVYCVVLGAPSCAQAETQRRFQTVDNAGKPDAQTLGTVTLRTICRMPWGRRWMLTGRNVDVASYISDASGPRAISLSSVT